MRKDKSIQRPLSLAPAVFNAELKNSNVIALPPYFSLIASTKQLILLPWRYKSIAPQRLYNFIVNYLFSIKKKRRSQPSVLPFIFPPLVFKLTFWIHKVYCKTKNKYINKPLSLYLSKEKAPKRKKIYKKFKVGLLRRSHSEPWTAFYSTSCGSITPADHITIIAIIKPN